MNGFNYSNQAHSFTKTSMIKYIIFIGKDHLFIFKFLFHRRQ